MDSLWRTVLWKQFGAAIDMLDDAVMACPVSLWQERLWRDPPPPEFPPQFAEFWYVTFHTLVWLDLYLSGVPEEEFAPPAPFAQGVLDSAEAAPERPYTREQLRAYLASLRQKCRAAIEALTDEQARRPVSYGWMEDGEVVSYAELQLYNMRHVQGHAAELSLFLGQHGVQTNDWTTRAKGDPGAS
jgi:DinB family protein